MVVVEGVAVILSELKAYALLTLSAMLAVLLGAQTLRLHSEQTAHAQLRADLAEREQRRATAALQHEIATTSQESTHAADTSNNADAYTTSQPVRDAIARADVARADRLRRDAESRAATYRAMAEAGSTACRDLADRHTTLDAHVVRGVAVVAGLRSDLDRRDAEVALLRQQINIDRALLTPPPRRPAGGLIEGSP